MKLDTKALRYLTNEDWRVLTAVETGSRNHEVVPTTLIASLSGGGKATAGVGRCISTLAKAGLVARVKGVKYDGYRLTYGGLDYLALHAHTKSSTIYSVGNQIGVGKESDIYVVAAPSGQQLVLKIHRLGRISFRTVKNNRDYERGKRRGGKFQGSGWMYMSRLAATKEFAFMKALGEKGLDVPEAIAHNRHTVVMGLVDALPLRSILEVPDPGGLYQGLMEIVVELKGLGLIHGDFNEFNILIKDEDDGVEKSKDGGEKEREDDSADQPEGESASARTRLTPVVIDFPQMLSISHPDAEFYFDRDVNCIRRFFERRFHFVSDVPGPFLSDEDERPLNRRREKSGGQARIDVQVEAAGFSRKMEKELQAYMKDVGVRGDAEADAGASYEREEENEDEDEEDDDGVEEGLNKSDERVEGPGAESLVTKTEVGHGEQKGDALLTEEGIVTDSSLNKP